MNKCGTLWIFREVNKRLVSKPFPIPKISTVLQELGGFAYATELDLNMGYCTIKWDLEASSICTIIQPWGKDNYERLTMCIAGSLDIFQEKISNLMRQLEFVHTYIDDLLMFSKGDFSDRLEKLTMILTKLRNTGMRVNVAKSKFAATECEFFWIYTYLGRYQTSTRKVAAIIALEPSQSVKQLKRFLGIAQYYRVLWEKRSKMLVPLTDLMERPRPQRKRNKE